MGECESVCKEVKEKMYERKKKCTRETVPEKEEGCKTRKGARKLMSKNGAMHCISQNAANKYDYLFLMSIESHFAVSTRVLPFRLAFCRFNSCFAVLTRVLPF